MILSITDGTTLVNLIWHSAANRKYMLARDGWAPAVAALDESDLGGRGPYVDIVEEIEVNVMGESPADALANLGTLGRLMDQAWRWWRRNENVSPVKIQYAPEGASNTLQSVILGRVPGDQTSGVNLPISFNRDLNAYMVAGVRLRFQRGGWWIGQDSSPATSASAANPSIHSVTFADNQLVSSPVKVVIGGLGLIASAFSGFLAVTDSASDMAIVEAESLARPASGFNSAVDANARGGNILSFNNNTTTFATSASAGGALVAARTYAVYATVRNNSATMSFLVRLAVSVSIYTYYTAPVPIDTSTTNPRAILLGVVVLPEYTAVINHSFAIEVAQATSGAVHVLDFDSLLVVNLDDETSQVIGIPNYALSTVGARLIVDDQILTAPHAVVGDNSQSPPYYTAYTGNPMLCSKGTTLAACLFATQGANWRIKNTTPAVCSTTLTAIRHNAAVVPS